MVVETAADGDELLNFTIRNLPVRNSAAHGNDQVASGWRWVMATMTAWRSLSVTSPRA